MPEFINTENAQKDYLTGFYLRDTLYSFLKKLIAASEPRKEIFSIVLIDIDHFKKFNDKLGHFFGDDVLKYAADTFRLFFKESYCFRHGGDEFIAVLINKNPEEAFDIVMQIKKSMVVRPFLFQDRTYQPFKVTFSCGIATYPLDGSSVNALIQKADEAMYFSKRHGRNLITLSHRVKFLKLRNSLALSLVILLIIGGLALLYQTPLKRFITKLAHNISNVNITITPKKVDIITFKNGGILMGKIVEETTDRLVVEMSLDSGKGLLVVKRSDISEIKYAMEKTAE